MSMNKYVVRVTASLDVSYVIEGEDMDDAMENSLDRFDPKNIVGIDHIHWDKPWDIEEYAVGAPHRVLTEKELKPYQEAGII